MTGGRLRGDRGRVVAPLVAVFVFHVAVTSVGAQELLFSAPEVHDVWVGNDGVLYVQHGDRVSAPYVPGTERRVAPLDRLRLPEGTRLYDVGAGSILVLDAEARVDGRVIPIAAPLFRLPPPWPPRRMRLLLGGGKFVVPTRSEWLVFGGAPDEVERLGVSPEGRVVLGWGLGDTLASDLVVPHLLPRARGGAFAADLLTGFDRRFVRHRPGAAAAELVPPPGDLVDGILDFPHAVPPVVSDLDQDGRDDLLLVDPSAGALSLYADLDAERPAPTRVLLAGGLVLAAFVRDLDRDGAADLVVLKIPKPSLFGQLKVLERGELPGEALFYGGVRGALFETSPKSRTPLTVPIEISVVNDLRSARFPAVLVPVPGPGLLKIDPKGDGVVIPLDERTTPRGLRPLGPGRAAAPFEILDLGLHGTAFVREQTGETRVHLLVP